MKAKSIKGKTPEEIQSRLRQSKEDNFNPTLAIVFISVRQDRDVVCKILNDAGISIYGATSNGEFIDEDYGQGTIAILLLDIDPRHFFIQFAQLNGKDERQVASTMATEASRRFRNPAFLLTACDLKTDAEELIAGFTDVIENVNINGGLAGDDLSFGDQFVFTNDNSGSRAVLTIAFDQDKLIMRGRASHGWKAFGTVKTITKSDGNRIYTIDNEPALDICLRYTGIPIDHPNLKMELILNCPLQVEKEEGDSIMRPGYDVILEDHSMLTTAKIPTGSRVRFSLPPDFDVIQKVVDENISFRETEMPDADALVVYNCGGRLLTLGPFIGQEIKGMQDVWNVPMAGMFSTAEIGRTKNGQVELHNLTTCWVALKEK
jgi:hypothetical protein